MLLEPTKLGHWDVFRRRDYSDLRRSWSELLRVILLLRLFVPRPEEPQEPQARHGAAQADLLGLASHVTSERVPERPRLLSRGQDSA